MRRRRRGRPRLLTWRHVRRRRPKRRRRAVLRNRRAGSRGAKVRHNQYIASLEWAIRRENFKDRHGRSCRVCGSNQYIEVHHVTYARAHSGNEPDKDLRVLCRTHHQMAHDYEQTGRYRSLKSATEAMINDVLRPRPGPARQWIRQQWLVLTGRRW